VWHFGHFPSSQLFCKQQCFGNRFFTERVRNPNSTGPLGEVSNPGTAEDLKRSRILCFILSHDEENRTRVRHRIVRWWVPTFRGNMLSHLQGWSLVFLIMILVVLISWGGLRLSPLGTSATNWPYCTIPGGSMSMEHLVEWELVGETEVLGGNLPQCHFAFHKFHMNWDRTRAVALGSRRLTAWAMARPDTGKLIPTCTPAIFCYNREGHNMNLLSLRLEFITVWWETCFTVAPSYGRWWLGQMGAVL
jgi:hypothetical protein